MDNKPLPNPCPQHKRVKMNQFERNQNIEKLFNQFMEKCKTGYYRKIGVTRKKNGAVFNNSVLDAYNLKHNKDEEKRI